MVKVNTILEFVPTAGQKGPLPARAYETPRSSILVWDEIESVNTTWL
jgi:hypothetical protein